MSRREKVLERIQLLVTDMWLGGMRLEEVLINQTDEDSREIITAAFVSLEMKLLSHRSEWHEEGPTRIRGNV